VNVAYYEIYQIQSDYVTADLLVWQRYRQRAPGVLEQLLDDNPQLAVVHRTTPFIPAGTLVRIPIDPSLMLGKPVPATAGLWTDRQGYRL
jgi:phage tail protein X